VAKRIVGTPTKVAAGTWRITYEILVRNYGAVDLNNLQIMDDLSATFKDEITQQIPTTFTVVDVVSDDFSVNWPLTIGGGYNGNSEIKLLTGVDILPVGSSGLITVVVDVVPALIGPYENTAIALAEEGIVTDLSNNGSDPDPDSDTNPGNNNSPTGVEFSADIFDPPHGIKTFDNLGNSIVLWEAVWLNDNNLIALNAKSSDPIPAGSTFYDNGVSNSTSLPLGVPFGSTISGVDCVDDSAISYTTYCYFEGPTLTYPRGRIVWEGTIGSDYGIKNAEAAKHSIHIFYRLRVEPTVATIKNVATISFDSNGNGTYTDAGESGVANATKTWNRYSNKLPITGFAPDRVSKLPNGPQEKPYSTTDMILEIPSLRIKMPIVGIPITDDVWDVSWLSDQAGYLSGTAFPTWKGNSVLTAHVYNINGLPGPFVDLGKLAWGDKFYIRAYGGLYTYEVRSNIVVDAGDLSPLAHKDESWITLLTCKSYNPESDNYKQRTVVQGILVKVEALP